jgi:broad specificity phosphatase PhoE
VSEHDRLVGEGRDVRILHVVRHAQGTHNVDQKYRDPRNHDARLTGFGEQQCEALSRTPAAIEAQRSASLVVTSPLTRCVQTALLSFPDIARREEVPFVALECIRETVNFACDGRRRRSEIAADFPRVNFSADDGVGDEDELWARYENLCGPTSAHDGHRESCDLPSVADRGRAFFAWLRRRPEREAIVSSHSAFLRCVFSWGQDGGVRAAPDQALGESVWGELVDVNVPVVDYRGDVKLEYDLRRDWENCEMRTFLVAF